METKYKLTDDTILTTMEKKYKLTNETINVNGVALYRIEALKDFSDVKKGDKGGFVQSENNLSHNGTCWVYNDAIVYGYAQVYSNAKVYGSAVIHGFAKVYDYAKVYANAKIFDNAKVYDHAEIYGYAEVFDYAKVYGNAKVCANAKIFDNAKVYDHAEIYGYAEVFDYAKVYGNAKVCDNALICNKAEVYGDAKIYDDAKIENNSDYITFKNWWSSGRYFTWTRSNNMWTVGCFYGTGKELIKKAYKDSERSGKEYERVVNYVESILKEKQIKAFSKITKYVRRLCTYIHNCIKH